MPPRMAARAGSSSGRFAPRVHTASAASAALAFLLVASALPAAGMIAGYPTAASVVQGGTLELHVSTDQPSYDLVIEDAFDPELVYANLTHLDGLHHPIPDSAFAWGCQWPVSVALPIDSAWPCGVYYARLIAAVAAPRGAAAAPVEADTSFVTFVIREDDPGSHSSILFQLSTNTYQSYNAWGGRSLYPQNSLDNRRSYFVSTQRPYDQERGQGEFPWWERPLAGYVLSAGIPLEFCTNDDLHRDPELLSDYRLFVSAGHDEYYSKPMVDQLEAFRAQGGNLAFFSGNSVFWSVRFAGNTMVCYKELALDPYFPQYPDLVTVNWRSAPLNRPEGRLMGVQFDSWCWRPCGWPLRVYETDHWVTRGLELEYYLPLGDMVVGYEWDRRSVTAAPPGLEIVFQTLTSNHAGTPGAQQSSYYEYPTGEHPPGETAARIFAAGTIQWGLGVGPDSPGRDPRLQAITTRIVRCLNQPSDLAADRTVTFVADLRHLNLSPSDTLRLRGTPAPLSTHAPGLAMRDDGVPPDSVAEDRIYARTVVFPAGEWDIAKYEYWTHSQCWSPLYSAWLEDPEDESKPVLTLANKPTTCFGIPAAVLAETGAPTAGAHPFALDVRRIPAGVELVVTLPSGTGGTVGGKNVQAAGKGGGNAPGDAIGGRPEVALDLYDVRGRLVRRLHRGVMTEERLVVPWHGEDERGTRVATGVYMLRARVGDEVRARKLVW